MIVIEFFFWQIFGEVSVLQEKARKEGILKSDETEQKRMSEDNNFLVGNFVFFFFFIRRTLRTFGTNVKVLLGFRVDRNSSKGVHSQS